MNLARHSITATNPVHIFDARFDADCRIFTVSTPAGFAVYRACPIKLIRKRELTDGTLSAIVPLHTTNILFLLGGGRSPLYPQNKVIIWDDALEREVAELEFRERVCGLACRRGWLAVALRRRVVVFEVNEQVTRHGEWETGDNPRGLLAIATAPFATLLAIAGRKTGHVQLIHLPPCPLPVLTGPPPPTPPRKPPLPPAKHPISIIAAHTTALTTVALPPSGRLLATTSSRGTLVRIWDAMTGKLVRELRRGTDKADIYGVAFRPDERELCVWSDKGTVHVFTLGVSGTSNRQSSFSPLTPFLPLPKYFESEWSYAQYRIPVQSSHISLTSTSRSSEADAPDEERCTVGWVDVHDQEESGHVPEYQLVALTYTGGWYRLALPAGKLRKDVITGFTDREGRVATESSPPRMNPLSISQGHRRTDSGSSAASISMSKKGEREATRDFKGKGKEVVKEKEGKERECVLLEYRRFGRWDGWG